MALNKKQLEVDIEKLLLPNSDIVDDKTKKGITDFSKNLSDIIDKYIKTGTIKVNVNVNVNTTGTATIHTGTGTGTGTGTIS